MCVSRGQQSTAASPKRTSISQGQLHEGTRVTTHQAEPTPPDRSCGGGASRLGCGMRLASWFPAKRRKLDRCTQPHNQQSTPSKSFVVYGGRTLNSPFDDTALGSPSTTVSASMPRFPEPISPVKLPGPLLMQRPEGIDSGVQLPQLVPAMPSYGELCSPGRLRRGGNNQKRSHPRKECVDSVCSYSGYVVQYGIIQRDVGHVVQRTASVHSMAGIICSAVEDAASGGIDNALYTADNPTT